MRVSFFIPALRTSRILALGSSSHRERGSRRCFVGKDRRLRLAANVAARPGRFRPRVPLRALRPVRAGRAHRRNRGRQAAGLPRRCQANKCRSIATAGTEQRNGREQKSPDGARKPRHLLTIRRGTAMRPASRTPELAEGSARKERSLTKARRRMPGVATEKRGYLPS